MNKKNNNLEYSALSWYFYGYFELQNPLTVIAQKKNYQEEKMLH